MEICIQIVDPSCVTCNASFVIEIKRTSTELNRKRMTIFFEQIALALRTDEDFFERIISAIQTDEDFIRTDKLSRSNGCRFFQMDNLSCSNNENFIRTDDLNHSNGWRFSSNG